MWDELFTFLLAWVIFASILKVIHMLRFNKKMSMLAGTLKKAAQELSAFSVVFVCFIIAFMSLGFLTFGANVQGYSTVLVSLETLLSFALGHYQFEELSMANRTLGPVFFFAYIMFVVLLMLNMFVTILNDSFSVVRSKVNSEKNEYEIVAFMWGYFRSWINLTGLVPKAKGKYSGGYYTCLFTCKPFLFNHVVSFHLWYSLPYIDWVLTFHKCDSIYLRFLIIYLKLIGYHVVIIKNCNLCKISIYRSVIHMGFYSATCIIVIHTSSDLRKDTTFFTPMKFFRAVVKQSKSIRSLRRSPEFEYLRGYQVWSPFLSHSMALDYC